MTKTPPKRADSNMKKQNSYSQPYEFSKTEQMYLGKT